MIRSFVRNEASLILDSESELDTKWENGTRVFCIDSGKEYRLINGTFTQLNIGIDVGDVGAPTGGQLLIGKEDGSYNLANLTAGTGIIISNEDGQISIQSTAGGASTGANADITSMTALSGPLKAPSMVQDSSGNEVLKFGAVASAVNELTITNAATGYPAKLDATGSDTDVDILITPKGDGIVEIAGTDCQIGSNTTNVPLKFTTGMSPKVVALTDGATPALDASLGNVFTLLAEGNRTIAIPSNAVSGQRITIRHCAVGADRTLALNTSTGGFRYGSDITGLTATSNGKMDYIDAIYNEADNFWDVILYKKGY